MPKIEILKEAVGIISGVGVTTIIAGIVRSTTPTDTAVQKATVFSGQVVIGLIARDVAKQYTDAKIDAAVDWWKINITDKKPTR
jgi:hypothetical protein